MEEVFQKQRNKRPLHGLELRDRLVKFCEVVAVLPAVRWPRLDVAGEFHMVELQGAPNAGRALASEADRGVDRDSIELGVCISIVFQSGQRPGDLKQDFLIEIVAIRWLPRTGAADCKNLWSILFNQLQKAGFIWLLQTQSLTC